MVDKKAIINYNNKHNIKYDSIFTITQKNKFFINGHAVSLKMQVQ